MIFISQFLGALVPTFLLSRLFLFIMKNWDGGWQKILFAHTVSLICAILIAGMGMANGGAFVPIKALASYVLPQLFWFGVDYWRYASAKTPISLTGKNSE